MQGAMSLLNDLVRQVRETHQLSLEAVSAVSDLSTSAINRYELGQVEVPFRYVRSLFNATGDLRILRYFSPQLAETFCCLQHQQQCAAAASTPKCGTGVPPVRTPPPGDPKELMPRELQAIEDLAKAAKYVVQIVADGRIDDSDNLAIGNLLQRHQQVREILDAADRALIAWRESAAR